VAEARAGRGVEALGTDEWDWTRILHNACKRERLILQLKP
jgi:hypothetical protein